jgi:hypothetical protein
MRPLAIDLFCGLGGWTDGLLLEGYDVIGFDIERHEYGDMKYPAQLVIQDVLTIQGSQFKDAALIVASPPCQEYSYMAMPWKRAKQIAHEYRTGVRDVKQLTALFDACFRIQREACEAAGRHIPLVVENVRGAIPWVGRSRWNYGSFHLWGDVPALMPMTMKRGVKVGGLNWSKHGTPGYAEGPGRCFPDSAIKNTGGSWFSIAHNTTSGKGRNPDGRNDPRDGIKGVPHRPTEHWTNPEENGTKCGGDWFNGESPSDMRHDGSKSSKRKMASAMIAKIPLTLSRHIARSWYPERLVAVGHE